MPFQQHGPGGTPFNLAPWLRVVLRKERDYDVGLLAIDFAQFQIAAFAKQFCLIPLVEKDAVAAQLFGKPFNDISDEAFMLTRKGDGYGKSSGRHCQFAFRIRVH